MKHRSIEIMNYAGLAQRSAEALMNLNVLIDGAFAEVPEEESVSLKRLECLDDVQGLIASDPSHAEGSAIAQAFCQKRWLGTGLIANLQNPTILPEQITGNVGTFIAFRIPDPTAAAFVCKILHGPPEMVPLIQKLPPRHFLVRSLGFEDIVHGVTQTIHAGAPPNRAKIDRHMKPVLDDISASLILSPPYDDNASPITYGEDNEIANAEEPQPQASMSSVLADHIALLKAIMERANENLSTRELYRVAGVNPDKGGRLKRDLIQNGLIHVEKVASRGRPREVIEATDEGRRLVNEVR